MPRATASSTKQTLWDFYLAQGLAFVFQATQGAVAANNSQLFLDNPASSGKMYYVFRALWQLSAAGLVQVRQGNSVGGANIAGLSLTERDANSGNVGLLSTAATGSGIYMFDSMDPTLTKGEFSTPTGEPFIKVIENGSIIFTAATQNVGLTMQVWFVQITL